MINFGISAPGKVILFGEHAVVHGKTAIAVSLGQRASLEFSELPSQESYVYIELPKVRVSEKFAVEELRRGLKDLPDINHGHDKFLEYVKQLVKIDVKDSAKVSIECFLYALFQVAQGELLEIKPFKLKLDSELSIGAGTGSSASYSVCLNAAFLRWSQLQKNFSAPPEFNKVSLEKISKYAFNCEKIMHGSPSGIDNSICTFGSVIQFRKGEPPKFVSLGSRSLRILLVDTRVGRNTKVMVARLAELLRKFPTIFNKVLECIDEVSLSSVHIFKRLQALDGLADKQIENEKAKLLFEELSVSSLKKFLSLFLEFSD